MNFNDEIKVESYKRFTALMKQRLPGISLYAFAERLEISRTNFSNWKSGRNMPNEYNMNKIANALHVDPDYLYCKISRAGELKEAENELQNVDYFTMYVQRYFQTLHREITDHEAWNEYESSIFVWKEGSEKYMISSNAFTALEKKISADIKWCLEYSKQIYRTEEKEDGKH